MSKAEKMNDAVEIMAGNVSEITVQLEQNWNSLRNAASLYNKGFLPGSLQQDYDIVMASLNSMFDVLSQMQS